jgi:hypothetical protein
MTGAGRRCFLSTFGHEAPRAATLTVSAISEENGSAGRDRRTACRVRWPGWR